MPDGAVRIFLNTRGKNREEVGDELAWFLEYAEKTDEKTVRKSGSEVLRRIHEHICKLKASEEMGVRYMQAWEEKVKEREEGREEGLKVGISRTKRVLKLAAEGKKKEEIAEMCGITVEEVAEILE